MQVTMSNHMTEGVCDYGGFKIGFHMVGSCRPLSKFIVPSLRWMWMASTVLLFQYSLTLLFTLAHHPS